MNSKKFLTVGARPWRGHSCLLRPGSSGSTLPGHRTKVEMNLDTAGKVPAPRPGPGRRNRLPHHFLAIALGFLPTLFLNGCGSKVEAGSGTAEAPPAVKVDHEENAGIFKVEHPEQFQLATAKQRDAAQELNVTGSVNPDVSRTVPVISLASGRVVEIHARLGDSVTKGQLLMRVQSADISQAFSDYRQALADETLAHSQYDRAKLLYDKGAIAQKDMEVALNADTKAKVTVDNTREHLRVLGADVEHPSSLIDIFAPVSGVITEQNVTNAAGVKTLDNSPNLFTIADLSDVWIVCDVFENDLPYVRMGEFADIHLNAYPDLALKGRIDNIGPVLDPSNRTAKVRLEVHNPGTLRLGMFVRATFYGAQREVHAVVPAPAVLHLHDRDWVYTPLNEGSFKRVEVTGGKMLPDNMQEILKGLKPGQKVVARALELQNTVEQ
jgi:cobalt-zinc-cadmium efflux system membrane fusion protein